MANVHKLLHSATESIFADFKGTFLEIWGLLLLVYNKTSPKNLPKICKSYLHATSWRMCLSVPAASHTGKLCKEHLPYVKPEEHRLEVGEKF